MQTTVLNLIGGPGIGKSTLAAKTYSEFKSKNASCELVREFVKDWAWEDRKVKPLDQLYLLGQQCYRESLLYGKVEYIITDSPLIMNGFYSEHYLSETYLTDSAIAFMNHSMRVYNGLRYVNIILPRTKTYDTAGRFEDEETAKIIDQEMVSFLDRYKLKYVNLTDLNSLSFAFLGLT
jgi:nicotinamide riboside kinase